MKHKLGNFTTLLNEARMASSGGGCILVEGWFDKQFFDKLKGSGVTVRHPMVSRNNNKTLVMDLTKKIHAPGPSKASTTSPRLIGIVDTDFNHILGKKQSIPFLFYSDYHDFEIEVITSPAFDRFLTMFTKPSKSTNIKHKNVNQSTIQKVKDAILDHAALVGVYKLALHVKKVIDKGLLSRLRCCFFPQVLGSIDHVQFESLLGSLLDPNIATDVANEALSWMGKNISREHLANGHDAMDALKILLDKQSFNVQLDDIRLSKVTTLAKIIFGQYDTMYFKGTRLHADILTLQKARGWVLIHN